MHRPARTRRARLALVLAVTTALTLTACTADADDPDAAGSASPTPTGPTPQTVVATGSGATGYTRVETTVYPLVRSGEHVVLTLDVTAVTPSDAEASDDDRLFAGTVFWDASEAPLDRQGSTGFRLLDLERDLVYLPAVDDEPRTVGVGNEWAYELPFGVPRRIQLAYAAPEADELALVVPGVGVVPDVPVIDGEVPGPQAPATSEQDAPDGSPTTSATSSRTSTPEPTGPEREPIDLGSVVAADVVPLTTSTFETETPDVRRDEDVERLTVALGSDVLFASESAELSPEARVAIDRAVVLLRERGAGQVQVVGHTDSVADDASNQVLSEQRAASVAAVLGTLLDPAGYPLVVSGAGERQPVATNDSPEGRQQNRRVELTLETERLVEALAVDERPLPPAPKRTGTGAEGVLLDSAEDPEYLVRAPRAYLLDGHLVVPFEVTPYPPGTQQVSLPAYFGPTPGDLMTNVVLLQGGTAIRPLQYAQTHRGELASAGCVCDVDVKQQIAADDTATFTVVFPELGTPEAVMLQVLGGGFRLTDIPVDRS
ncbi:OmpA family protein [Cellulomonas sp. NS3]|uniref:OmpA family protein n=1 Tax=Cellulomonas sp. NS3 TaxID=2973977 RepID=UPI002161385C|nr:OmpA family protein [Cellulomonas sp. NS3]